MSQKKLSILMNTMGTLTKRELVSSLRGWGIYIAAFVSFLVSSWMLNNHLNTLKENTIIITSYPLETPLSWSVIIVSLYLVFISAISISREREQGTLEVLWYGPVSSFSYLLGKYFKDIILYLIVLVFFGVYFWVVSTITNLGFTIDLAKAFLVSIFVVSCFVSFGLFISSLATRVRSSVIWLVGILLAFLALWFANSILNLLPEESLSSSLLYIRRTLSLIFTLINWISPFSYLSRGMGSIPVGNNLIYTLNIVYSIIYSVILLSLSMFILKRKGVKA